VTVVNFLNFKNRAKQRVYDLLSEKFHLFEGVFGASDEVLGVIERGVDIERRILEIVQAGRCETEIDTAFDALQDELQAEINEQVLDARKRLLESVDEQAVSQLKTRDDEIRQNLSAFEKVLLLVARAELPEARFHDHDPRRFDWNGDTYTTEWPLADEQGWKFFRLIEGTLAPTIIERAKARTFDAPERLRFDLSAYPGLVGRRGTPARPRRLASGLSKLRIASPTVSREHLAIAAFADTGEAVHPDTVERLMAVPATILETAGQLPEEALARLAAERKAALLEQAEQENGAWLDAENEKLDAYADDLERAFEMEVKALEAEIREAKKALRGASLPMTQKLAEKRRISGLEAKRDKMKIEFFDRRAQIRDEVEAMLDRIQESLKIEPTLTPLFTLRWEIV
jgi:hypothetical protein